MYNERKAAYAAHNRRLAMRSTRELLKSTGGPKCSIMTKIATWLRATFSNVTAI